MALTYHQRVNNLFNIVLKEIPSFLICSKLQKIQNSPICSLPVDFHLLYVKLPSIVKAYKQILENKHISITNTNENLSRLFFEDGMLNEAIAVSYLCKSSLLSKVYVNQSVQTALNTNQVLLDGKVSGYFYFDIKTFCSFDETLNKVIKKLEIKYPNYRFYQSGDIALSKSNIISSGDFSKIQKLVNQGSDSFSFKLKNNSCYILGKKRGGIVMTECHNNEFEMIKNLSKFPFACCSQFTKDKAFVQINVYDEKNCLFGFNFEERFMFFRLLSRRVFFENKASKEEVKKYDNRISECSYTIACASKLLSGLLFIGKRTGESFFFKNPFSIYKVNSRFFEIYQWDNRNSRIDDFHYDNY